MSVELRHSNGTELAQLLRPEYDVDRPIKPGRCMLCPILLLKRPARAGRKRSSWSSPWATPQRRAQWMKRNLRARSRPSLVHCGGMQKWQRRGPENAVGFRLSVTPGPNYRKSLKVGLTRPPERAALYSARSSSVTSRALAKARSVVTEPCLRPVSISVTVTRFTPAFAASAACVRPRKSR